MGNKLCPKIILEGTRLTFKTEIAFELNKRPLGMIRRNIDRRKPNQRICRNTHFVTVKVKVYVHAGSLHEAGRDVNLRIINLHRDG